jgi:glycolate oxidase FAD binding subunit
MITQATGIVTLRLEGDSGHLTAAIEQLRGVVEGRGGSVVILHRPKELASLNAWGNAGDAINLMRAVKKQLDPKSTLNPGRFVGGI